MLYLSCMVLLTAGSTGSTSSKTRTVMAWASPNPATVAQLRNESWAGIFDGVQAQCGVKFGAGGMLEVNMTNFAACADLQAAVKATKGRFHVWINGVPPAAIANPGPAVASAVALALQLGVDGFSIDDEYDCAPRSTLKNFTSWVGFIDELATGLHTEKLELSAAVQAMFGIQDVEYKPTCSPQDDPSCSQACNKAPYTYKNEPKVAALMSHSKIDRWLEMDTYYFGTGRFLNSLDWYTENVALDKLGVAVMNRNDISEDGYLARFHAIERSGADWLNLFILPAAEVWLPYLRRWKTGCAGCGAQPVLGCYDLSVKCGAY